MRTKALVLPDLAPGWGGTSVSVPALCKAMHAHDSSVGLFFAADDKQSTWPDYFHHHMKSPPRAFHASRSLRRSLEAQPFSIIHHHALWLPSLGYSYRGAQRSHCPFVISPRGMLSPYALRRARVKKWLASRLLHPGALAGATAWHATSELEFRDIRAAGFDQPILLSPNGVAAPEWNEAVDRVSWLKRYPALRGRRVCLFFSRFHSKKGILPLLEMWCSLSRGQSDWHLLLAGSRHEYTGIQLQGHVNRLGLRDRVTVADPNGLAKPYPLAELYVLPTQSENFGLTIGESLAVGVPVLTTIDAPWERVNELGCGVCVPMYDFCAQLNKLLSLSSDALRKMGQIGREWVTAAFCWPHRGREMLDFYGTLGAI